MSTQEVTNGGFANNGPSSSSNGVVQGQGVLLNGVTPTDVQAGTYRDERMENPNLQDQPATSTVTPQARTLASGEVFMGFTDPPYGNVPEPQVEARAQQVPVQTPPTSRALGLIGLIT